MPVYLAPTMAACPNLPSPLGAFPAGRLIVSEDRATGGVSGAVYGLFFKYMGTFIVIFITGAVQAAVKTFPWCRE